MLFVGIDNGLNGGISVIDEREKIILKGIMPTFSGTKKEFDVQTISKFMRKLLKIDNEIYVFIEEARVQPVSGKRASFTTGFCYGLFQGICASLSLSYEIVAPKTWQKELLKGLATDTKVASVMYCSKKYPEEQWTGTERSKKPHDGLTDATCIALYGKRKTSDIL